MNLFKKYSFSQLLFLGYCYVRTKLISSKIRLLRFPIDIRGREYIDFGFGLTTGKGCRLEAEYTGEEPKVYPKLIFKKNIQINDYVHITAAEKVEIGDNVLIASKVYISDCSHGSYGMNDIHDHPDTVPKERKIYSSPVYIRKNVWIGENVAILKGVEIGEGSIIGANSVVSKSIPAFSIAAGVPAQVIKVYDKKLKKWKKI